MKDAWLFTGGYVIQMIATALLLYQIYRKRSIFGLSSDTQICFFVSTLCRIYWYHDTRLLETYVSYVELFGCTVVQSILCYYIYRYRHTTTKEARFPLRAYVLVPACLLCAILIHPGKTIKLSQVFVAFSIYLESLALLPQLWLMTKMLEIDFYSLFYLLLYNGHHLLMSFGAAKVEPLTSHYVAMLVLSRICRMIFWVVLYVQNERFLCLLMADLIHTILAADYLYLWFKKLRFGGALIVKL